MFFRVIHQISRSHGLKNRRFESNLSKITRPVAAIKSLRFALFRGDEVIDDVTRWPQSFPLYSCLGEVGCGSKGNILSINANIIIVFLGYTCQKMISMNNTYQDCMSKVNITDLLGDLGA